MICRIIVLAAAASASVLSAAAQSAAPEAPPERCLFNRSIDGFKQAERASVILSQGTRDFRVTFRSPCREMPWAQTIATVSIGGGLCLQAGDKIVLSPPSGIQETCYIATIAYVPKPGEDGAPAR